MLRDSLRDEAAGQQTNIVMSVSGLHPKASKSGSGSGCLWQRSASITCRHAGNDTKATWAARPLLVTPLVASVTTFTAAASLTRGVIRTELKTPEDSGQWTRERFLTINELKMKMASKADPNVLLALVDECVTEGHEHV